jgi:hypothetical protein
MDTMEYARSQVGIAMGSVKEGINGRRQRKWLAFKNFKFLDDTLYEWLDERHKLNSPIKFYSRRSSVQTLHNRLNIMHERMKWLIQGEWGSMHDRSGWIAVKSVKEGSNRRIEKLIKNDWISRVSD